tara:strand:+ start:3334 stop:4017 length:684 start_codon:yes stop_codon:yes gene_type:complete
MTITYFKVYGQMRTGTNYLVSTIYNNFENVKVYMNIGGWKHGKLIKYPNKITLINTVDETTKNNIDISNTLNLYHTNKINFIIIVKNPYMWIYSMSIYKKKEITSSFVIEHINMWNKFYANYKNYIENDNVHLIRYETLIKFPTEALDIIKSIFNLTNKYKKYMFENRELKPNDDTSVGLCKNKIFDKTIYINPNINNYLTKNIISLINTNIDIALMDFYAYRLVEI